MAERTSEEIRRAREAARAAVDGGGWSITGEQEAFAGLLVAAGAAWLAAEQEARAGRLSERALLEVERMRAELDVSS